MHRLYGSMVRTCRLAVLSWALVLSAPLAAGELRIAFADRDHIPVTTVPNLSDDEISHHGWAELALVLGQQMRRRSQVGDVLDTRLTRRHMAAISGPAPVPARDDLFPLHDCAGFDEAENVLEEIEEAADISALAGIRHTPVTDGLMPGQMVAEEQISAEAELFDLSWALSQTAGQDIDGPQRFWI